MKLKKFLKKFKKLVDIYIPYVYTKEVGCESN